jgi:hypothetical protein
LALKLRKLGALPEEVPKRHWRDESNLAPRTRVVNAILHQACNDLTAITQLRFGPPPGGAVKAPKGRCAGVAKRSALTAPRTAERSSA